MTIRIEVTGGTAADVAQELMSFALLMAPRMREHLTTAPVVPAGLGEMAAAEAAADVPVEQPAEKKRGRKPKSEEQKDVPGDDVERAGAGGDEPASGRTDGAAATELVHDEHATAAAAKDESPAEVDALPEAEPEPVEQAAEPALTTDQLQKYVVQNYLMVVTTDQEVRTATYRALLDKFGIPKLKDASPEQVGEIKAYVDGEIATHKAGRKG